jgi:Bardet-Biedl syndrome 9 protein
MFFVARLVPPVKEPTFKFTLETNKPPVLLATLFEDVFFAMGETESTQAAGNNANYVLSFRYWMADNSNNNNNNNNNNDDSGMHATIMLSKNAGRYRIQSHHFGALWFVASELTIRLNKVSVLLRVLHWKN